MPGPEQLTLGSQGVCDSDRSRLVVCGKVNTTNTCANGVKPPWMKENVSAHRLNLETQSRGGAHWGPTATYAKPQTESGRHLCVVRWKPRARNTGGSLGTTTGLSVALPMVRGLGSSRGHPAACQGGRGGMFQVTAHNQGGPRRLDEQRHHGRRCWAAWTRAWTFDLAGRTSVRADIGWRSG